MIIIGHQYKESYIMCVMRQRFAQPFFFIGVFLHVTPNGLSERDSTRSLDSSKGEVFHVVHVWK